MNFYKTHHSNSMKINDDDNNLEIDSKSSQQKESIRHFEQQNILVQFFLKVGINTIIDRYLNQIIVCELQSKISSVLPSTVDE